MGRGTFSIRFFPASCPAAWSCDERTPPTTRKKYPFKFFFHALQGQRGYSVGLYTMVCMCQHCNIQSKVILHFRKRSSHTACLNARSWIRFDEPRFCCTYRTIKETKLRPSNAEDGTRLWLAMVDGHELAVLYNRGERPCKRARRALVCVRTCT